MSLAESRARVAVKTSPQLSLLHNLRFTQPVAKSPIRRQIRRAPQGVSDGRSELHSFVDKSCGDRRRSDSRGTVPSGTPVHHRPHARDCATGRNADRPGAEPRIGDEQSVVIPRGKIAEGNCQDGIVVRGEVDRRAVFADAKEAIAVNA